VNDDKATLEQGLGAHSRAEAVAVARRDQLI